MVPAYTQNLLRSLAAPLLVLAIALQLGCSPSPREQALDRKAEQEADQEAILEVVFRFVLPGPEQSKLLATLGDGEVFFLTLTDSEGGYKDPPDDLVQLFASDLGVEVKPFSLATPTLPAEQGVHTPFYRDTESRKAGRLFHTSLPRWVDSDTVEVQAGSSAAPLASNWSTVVLRKADGQWRIVEVRDRWVT